MEYVIGVDGGGTKTEAVAYSLDGQLLKTSLTGFGNLVSGKEEGLKNITDAIGSIIDELGKEKLKGIYLGIAGSEVADNAEIIYKEIKTRFDMNSIVMNDGDLALKALLRGEDGILVIAGTGSTAFGVKGNKQARCGGWGHLLGDEGSAYRISIAAFKRMIEENDFGLDRSKVSQDILNKLGVQEVDEIIGFIYSATKDEIAQMAGIVSINAENGDEYAKGILVYEATELAKACERVFRKLGFESCKIGLVGGVIRKSQIFRETFENYLNENIKVNSFVDDDISAAKGAYYIYKREHQ